MWCSWRRSPRASGLDGDGAVGVTGDAGGNGLAVGLPDPVTPGAGRVDEDVVKEDAGGEECRSQDEESGEVR